MRKKSNVKKDVREIKFQQSFFVVDNLDSTKQLIGTVALANQKSVGIV